MRSDGLRLCLRFVGVFQSAAIRTLQVERQRHDEKIQGRRYEQNVDLQGVGGNLSRAAWTKAIINGADDRSPRWRHVMVIAGLLIGSTAEERDGLTKSLRRSIEAALVNAINLALEDIGVADETAAHCISVVLNHSFDLLSGYERSRLNYDRLLPVLIGSAYFSDEGYASAYFMAPIDMDLVQVDQLRFSWPEQSSSFRQISEMSTRPLVATMGPLSRLIAHTIENVSQAWLVQTALEDIAAFAKTLDTQWERGRVSEVDVSEERVFFDEHTLTVTMPGLWKVLRGVLFSLVIVLRGVMGRVLSDRMLASDGGMSLLFPFPQFAVIDQAYYAI